MSPTKANISQYNPVWLDKDKIVLVLNEVSHREDVREEGGIAVLFLNRGT
jgi:hypothetical protein